MIESQKIVYCLSASVGDVYEAMTRVSLATLRISNPNAFVIIACDQLTMQALKSGHSKLLEEADAVVEWPSPDGPAIFRNRYIKTQLGKIIEGPFLFIDSDTIVRKPVGALFELKTDVAAAPNHSVVTLPSRCGARTNLILI